MKTVVCTAVAAIVFFGSQTSQAQEASSGKWVSEGYKGGVGGVGAGSWQHSVTEKEGTIEARVWGPESGNTFGAEARIRTVKDFNDGRKWKITFAWDTKIGFRPHCDNFAIHITDGVHKDDCDWTWIGGTPSEHYVSLWRAPTDWNKKGDAPKPTFDSQSWSIIIDPRGTAELYTGVRPDGEPYRRVQLDRSQKWHMEFLLNSATSAGYDQVDNSFRMSQFNAVQLEEGRKGPSIAEDRQGSQRVTALRCLSCGKLNELDAKFCQGCGGRL